MSYLSIQSHRLSLQSRYMEALTDAMTYLALSGHDRSGDPEAETLFQKSRASFPEFKAFLQELLDVAKKLSRGDEVGLIENDNVTVELVDALKDRYAGSLEELQRDLEAGIQAAEADPPFRERPKALDGLLEKLSAALESGLEQHTGTFRF